VSTGWDSCTDRQPRVESLSHRKHPQPQSQEIHSSQTYLTNTHWVDLCPGEKFKAPWTSQADRTRHLSSLVLYMSVKTFGHALVVAPEWNDQLEAWDANRTRPLTIVFACATHLWNMWGLYIFFALLLAQLDKGVYDQAKCWMWMISLNYYIGLYIYIYIYIILQK